MEANEKPNYLEAKEICKMFRMGIISAETRDEELSKLGFTYDPTPGDQLK